MVSSLREKVMDRTPKILVFDSGLGGLTVFRALLERRPDAQFFYAADDLGFPYGPKSEAEVSGLVLSAMERLIAAHAPDCVVIACNTASTLVLPQLRERWPKIPFVGTVPAIKPAAEQSQSRLITILATPGTVARDYTRDLIDKFAGHCDVTLVGSQKLAGPGRGFHAGPGDFRRRGGARNRALFRRAGRQAHRRHRAGLHPLSAAARFFHPPRALAGPLDRPRRRHRAPRGSRDFRPVSQGRMSERRPDFSFQFTSGAAPAENLAAALAALRDAKANLRAGV